MKQSTKKTIANAHSLKTEKIFSILASSRQGLNEEEAKKRLKDYGPNLLAESSSISLLSIIINQFKNPFIYVLVFALAISLLTRHLIDVGIIIATILISTIIGVIQEYKADKSLASLKKIIHSKASLLREGKKLIVDQAEIVPGDILVIKAGDKILADARILELKDLEVNEATLTGESLSIYKINEVLEINTSLADRKNMLYAGTVACAGYAKAIVIATGHDTELGKIANLLLETKNVETPLQKQMLSFGKKLSIALVLVNLLIFLLGVILHKSIYEMFLTSVALVVAAVPEGLMPAMSIILATGMQKLSKRKGLVRRMLAAETLGSITTICTDKTGTLTTGEMTMAGIYINSEKITELEILQAAFLCNEAVIDSRNGEEKIIGNPTDKALMKAALNLGIKGNDLENKEPKIAELAFKSSQKFMATLHKNAYGFVIYVKGAPEKILEKSKLSKEDLEKLQKEVDKVTDQGYRVIAIAKKELKEEPGNLENNNIKDLEFLGLISLKDPVREDASEAIRLCLKAGIKPIMLTGDHKRTAISVAKEIGMIVNDESILEGKEIEKLEEKELRNILKKITVFARVEPKHKIAIVSALQKNNEVVAMTGDGINDSPALKKADIGVAVGSGTEIAKETADLILLDDNFMTIVEAIKQGRIIFNNLRKVILCLLIDSCTEMILVTGSILLTLPLPVIPAQILWVKLIEDTLPAISLSFEELDEEVMDHKPRSKDDQIINKNYVKLILSYTVTMDLTLLGLFCLLYFNDSYLEHTRTIIFVCLGITTLVGVFAIRSIRHHIWQINPFSNKLLLYTTMLSMLLYLLALYHPFFNHILKTVPLGPKDWMIIFGYSFFSLVVYETCKRKTIMYDASNRPK